MNKLILLLLLFTFISGKSQIIDTFYFDINGKKTEKENAVKKAVYTYNDNSKVSGMVKFIDANGSLISEIYYSNIKENQKHGDYKVYYPENKIQVHYKFNLNSLHGEQKMFHLNGVLKRNEYYRFGEMLSGKCYTSAGKDTTFYVYEVPAKFPGGENALYKYVRKNTNYPKKAKRKKIEGKVFVEFTITTDGSIENAKIKSAADEILEAEALRVVNSMPKWTPSYLDGKPVKSKYILPVTFRLK